jgi:hypothetical protein
MAARGGVRSVAGALAATTTAASAAQPPPRVPRVRPRAPRRAPRRTPATERTDPSPPPSPDRRSVDTVTLLLTAELRAEQIAVEAQRAQRALPAPAVAALAVAVGDAARLSALESALAGVEDVLDAKERELEKLRALMDADEEETAPQPQPQEVAGSGGMRRLGSGGVGATLRGDAGGSSLPAWADVVGGVAHAAATTDARGDAATLGAANGAALSPSARYALGARYLNGNGSGSGSAAYGGNGSGRAGASAAAVGAAPGGVAAAAAADSAEVDALAERLLASRSEVRARVRARPARAARGARRQLCGVARARARAHTCQAGPALALVCTRSDALAAPPAPRRSRRCPRASPRRPPSRRSWPQPPQAARTPPQWRSWRLRCPLRVSWRRAPPRAPRTWRPWLAR